MILVSSLMALSVVVLLLLLTMARRRKINGFMFVYRSSFSLALMAKTPTHLFTESVAVMGIRLVL